MVWVIVRSISCPVCAKSVNNQTFMYKLYKWFVCLSLILGQKFWPNKSVATFDLIMFKRYFKYSIWVERLYRKILYRNICNTVQSDFVSSSRDVFEMWCLSFHFAFITKFECYLLRYYRTWENFGTWLFSKFGLEPDWLYFSLSFSFVVLLQSPRYNF